MVPLNGTEYESEEVISKNIFTAEALSNVKINDVDMGEMQLNSIYPFNGGTRFSLKLLTAEQKQNKQLNDQITMTQVALADVYETILGGE